MISIQKDIEINGDGNKVVMGNDNSQNYHNHFGTKSKLSNLFDRLKETFENGDEVYKISEDLKRYTTIKDTLGLEEKLRLANKSHLFDDYSELKQEFNKKLTKYQYYEPAQDIFSYILAIVLEKYRNVIRPKIQNKEPEQQILLAISTEIVNPILTIIREEGCNDIIGLTSTEIEGMYHYLTGNCHIKWNL